MYTYKKEGRIYKKLTRDRKRKVEICKKDVKSDIESEAVKHTEELRGGKRSLYVGGANLRVPKTFLVARKSHNTEMNFSDKDLYLGQKCLGDISPENKPTFDLKVYAPLIKESLKKKYESFVSERRKHIALSLPIPAKN